MNTKETIVTQEERDIANEERQTWLEETGRIDNYLCSVPGCGFYANDDSDFCPKHY